MWRDSWYSRQNGSVQLGNGLGPRLQVGKNTGTDDYENRFAISYQEPAGFDYGETVVSATIYQKVRGTAGCFSMGGTPKVLIRRFSDPDEVVTENAQGGECTLSGAGAAATEWPGPTTTSTGQLLWDGGGWAVNDIVSKDVTALFTAWAAAKAGGTDKFGLAFLPSNAAGNAEEQITARKVAFTSSDSTGVPLFDGGNGPYMVVVTAAANTPPDAQTVGTPTGGVRVPAGTSRSFTGRYSDDDDVYPDFDSMTSLHIVVATSNHVAAGTGKLDTGVIYDVDSASFTPNSQFTWSATRTVSPQTGGTTYYWQYAVTDFNGPTKGGWSTVFSYVVDRIPITTKVRPT